MRNGTGSMSTHIRLKGKPVTTRIKKLGPAAASFAVTAALASCTAPTGAPPTNASPATNGIPSTAKASGESDYTDGQYTADGPYGTRGSSIGVTVTLADDIITAVSVTPHATDPTSLDYQNRFAAAVPAVVVGRNISEIKVDRLAGSSSTPPGFNAALEQIKEQAS
jgi:uncharacterized protein with FMN-binding domain